MELDTSGRESDCKKDFSEFVYLKSLLNSYTKWFDTIKVFKTLIQRVDPNLLKLSKYAQNIISANFHPC